MASARAPHFHPLSLISTLTPSSLPPAPGTLTPIVSNPDDAVLSSSMREAVRAVARLFPTAIISGRGRDKVQEFVGLQELYYAGSHGMDIVGPRRPIQEAANEASACGESYALPGAIRPKHSSDGSAPCRSAECSCASTPSAGCGLWAASDTPSTAPASATPGTTPLTSPAPWPAAPTEEASSTSEQASGSPPRRVPPARSISFQPGAAYAPLMDELFGELGAALAGIPGAAVEHNVFCLSVHYRNCAPADVPRVAEEVQGAVRERREVVVTRGRKVWEVRPRLDWDKGRALEHLLRCLELADAGRTFALYLGDDTTDEDAFAALKKGGLGQGIVVCSHAKPTSASWSLCSTEDVRAFLQRLERWGGSQSNLWHQRRECQGWRIAPAGAEEGGDRPA